MAGMRNRDLTENEYNQVHDYFYNNNQLRNMLMYSIQRWAGYRISETLSLQVKDIFNPDGAIKATIKVAKANMKGGKSRPAIPIHENLKADIEAYREYLIDIDEFYPERYLFKSRKGKNKPLTYVQAWRIVKAVYNILAIYENTATHSFRKTFAMSVLEKSGNDIVLLQEVLAHESPKTTIKYTRISEQKIANAVLAQ